jgi:hypothetical protein
VKKTAEIAEKVQEDDSNGDEDAGGEAHADAVSPEADSTDAQVKFSHDDGK